MAVSNGGYVGGLSISTSTNPAGVWDVSSASDRLARSYTASQNIWPLAADPNFSSVKGLYHFDTIGSLNGSQIAFADSSSANHPALLTTISSTSGLITSNSKWGGSSFLAQSGIAQTASTSDFQFGTGDFTWEFWVRFGAVSTVNVIGLNNAATQVAGQIYMYNTGSIVYYVNGAERIVSATSVVTANVWVHVAVARSGSSTIMYYNGSQVGSTYSDSNNYNAGGTLTIGAAYNSAIPCSAYFDDVRITKGVARYTGASLTVPTAPFPDY